MEIRDGLGVASNVRTSARARQPSQKVRDNEVGGLASIVEMLKDMMQQDQQQMQQQMVQFTEVIRRSVEANKRLETENKELKELIVGMKLDMDSLKAASTLWEQQSMVSPSQPRSYASVVQSGSGNPGTARTSLKSVSFGSSAGNTHSTTQSILKTASEQGFDRAVIVIQLRESEPTDADQIQSKFIDTIRTIEGLEELEFLDFKVFDRQNARSIRIVVTKQEEVLLRRTAETWIRTIQGARIIAPKWYALKADWVEVSLTRSGDGPGISESARQRFGLETGIEVKRMTWLKRPKDGAQFGSAVVKVTTKTEAEKLLSGRHSFGGLSLTLSPFIEQKTPKVCYKCQGYNHIARGCTVGVRCPYCAEQHEQSACKAASFKCANCSGPHRAFERQCKHYQEEARRISNLRLNDQVA